MSNPIENDEATDTDDDDDEEEREHPAISRWLDDEDDDGSFQRIKRGGRKARMNDD